nr:uncharacterized protein LOC112211081 isoform X4 [Halyomorpha halys]
MDQIGIHNCVSIKEEIEDETELTCMSNSGISVKEETTDETETFCMSNSGISVKEETTDETENFPKAVRSFDGKGEAVYDCYL